MRLFHNDDQVRPLYLLFGERHLCIVIKACGVDIDFRMTRKDRLSRRAAEFVLGAEKKDALFHALNLHSSLGDPLCFCGGGLWRVRGRRRLRRCCRRGRRRVRASG